MGVYKVSLDVISITYAQEILKIQIKMNEKSTENRTTLKTALKNNQLIAQAIPFPISFHNNII